MAPSDRPGSPLIDRARAEAHAWSFFQLVRLLAQQPPGWKVPGGGGPAGGENVRFRPAASMGFPRSDVDELDRLPAAPDGVERWRMTVNFMGLYGPASPLPNHFTEEILWNGADEDAARDYVDLFHHRMISFVYRAWEKYRYPLRFEKGGRDEFSHRVRCLFGLGTPGMEEGSGLGAMGLMRTAGLLADRHRSAAGLEQCLRTHFPGAGIRVQACAPRHARIPDAQRARLGRRTATLGEGAVLGERIVDLAGGFRIEIGPLTLAAFRRFLPGGDDLSRLVRLTRLYVRDPLDFSVLLRLHAAQVPALALAAPEPLPLGHLSWIRPRGAEEGRALVSVQRVDPLRLARASAPLPPPAAPRPAPAVRTGTPVSKPTPRVTPVRR